MSAAVIDIAEAVTAAINARQWTAPYDLNLGAERLYEPTFTLGELTDLRVSVVAAALTGVVMDRAKRRDMRYEVDVAFNQKLDAPADAVETKQKIGELLALVEEVGDYLFRLGSLVGMVPVAIENVPIYDGERMKRSEFLSIITLTYQEFR